MASNVDLGLYCKANSGEKVSGGKMSFQILIFFPYDESFFFLRETLGVWVQYNYTGIYCVGCTYMYVTMIGC